MWVWRHAWLPSNSVLFSYLQVWMILCFLKPLYICIQFVNCNWHTNNQNTPVAVTVPIGINLYPSDIIMCNFISTWMCLQSAPLAGSTIFLKVTGHLRDTFTLVCWMLSSELLANQRFTGRTGKTGYISAHRWQSSASLDERVKQVTLMQAELYWYTTDSQC